MRYRNYMVQIFVALKIVSNKLRNRHAETHIHDGLPKYLHFSLPPPPKRT